MLKKKVFCKEGKLLQKQQIKPFNLKETTIENDKKIQNLKFFNNLEELNLGDLEGDFKRQVEIFLHKINFFYNSSLKK